MNGATLKNPVTENDHHIGDITAPICMLQYGDFQCPFTAATVEIIDSLLKEHPESFCFAFRHFPLISLHPEAGVAAIASEAAALQGKFWEMYHALFEHNDNLTSEAIFDTARNIGLNMKVFLDDLERDGLMKKVNEDMTIGKRNLVHSTPTFFINGVRYHDFPSHENLEALWHPH